MTKLQAICDMFYLHPSGIRRHIQRGIPFYEIHDTFNNDELTRKEKRNYLYKLKIERKQQDMVWQRFMGDAEADYMKQENFMQNYTDYMEETI